MTRGALQTAAGVGASDSASASAARVGKTEATARRNAQSRDKSTQRVAFRTAGTLFSPAESLVWVLGLLGVGACIAPWVARGWLWLDSIGAGVVLVLCYDALALWLGRKEFAPVLLRPEKGLRGREGQTIQVPLALTASGQYPVRSEARVAIMPATRENETAIQVRASRNG